MLKDTSRALLWVLLLIVILPLSAYASHEWQGTAGGDVGGAGNEVNDNEAKGLIESFPSESELVGDWVIGGVTYVADASTVFEKTDGAFAVDVCVEVTFQRGDASNMATKIESQDAQACRGDDDDDGEDDGEDENEAKGVIESFPTDLVGDWVIGGVTYTADASTEFEQEHGAFAVDVCVEVTFQRGDASNTATKIESKEPQECRGDDDDDDDDDEDNDDLKAYGLVESFPADLVGDWVIGGVTYTADASTEFEQEHGAFAVGACVEIEYLPTSNQALEIESEHSYKCDGSNGSGESYSETKGVVESYPSALIGTWVVDGVSYTADASTRFEQEDGPFFVGGCVEIKYTSSDNAAVEIESEEASDCGGGSDDGSNNSRSKSYGLIETMPEGLIGRWTIGGMTFEATESTQFEQEDGDFAVGMCVEVTYTTANQINSATEIESEDAYRCSGGSSMNKVYGTVDSFPTGLYGTWVISGTNYVASPSTRFEEEDGGSFVVGGCVKVKYYTENGVNQATKIESEDDSCGGGESSESESSNKVYATIDSFPPSPYVGTWQIGGLTYDATNATEFDQDHAAFAVGACVEAKYTTLRQAQGAPSNTLIEVETENDYKCGGDGQAQFTTYGTVETMPTTADRTGTWQISGVAYEANESTQFEQEYGFFAIGAYVEVKYEMSGDSAIAKRIETHVAPGNGMQTGQGTLQSHDANDDWKDWVIQGVTYKADPAIEVGSGEQAPQVGETVSFNSYENNGARYLTTVNRAQTQTQQYQLFLPAVTNGGQ